MTRYFTLALYRVVPLDDLPPGKAAYFRQMMPSARFAVMTGGGSLAALCDARPAAEAAAGKLSSVTPAGDDFGGGEGGS